MAKSFRLVKHEVELLASADKLTKDQALITPNMLLEDSVLPDLVGSDILSRVEVLVKTDVTASAAIGDVQAVLVEEGQDLRSGTPLFTFDPTVNTLQEFDAATGDFIPDALKGSDSLKLAFYLSEAAAPIAGANISAFHNFGQLVVEVDGSGGLGITPDILHPTYGWHVKVTTDMGNFDGPDHYLSEDVARDYIAVPEGATISEIAVYGLAKDGFDLGITTLAGLKLTGLTEVVPVATEVTAGRFFVKVFVDEVTN